MRYTRVACICYTILISGNYFYERFVDVRIWVEDLINASLGIFIVVIPLHTVTLTALFLHIYPQYNTHCSELSTQALSIDEEIILRNFHHPSLLTALDGYRRTDLARQHWVSSHLLGNGIVLTSSLKAANYSIRI